MFAGAGGEGGAHRGETVGGLDGARAGGRGPMRLPDRRDRVDGRHQRRARRKFQPQGCRVRVAQQLQPGRRRRIGGHLGAVHGPVEARHVGQVRLAGELRIGGDEGRQARAPLRHVAALRWVGPPESPRQPGRGVFADQQPDGRERCGHHLLGQRAGVCAIGLQTAHDTLRAFAQPATHDTRSRIAEQRPQQHLLAQRLFVACGSRHDVSSASSASTRSARAASASSTSGAGRSVSHSTSVGRGPSRWMACR